MRRYLEESVERNERACVRACVGGGVEGQDRSDGGERKENDAWALWFWSGQTSADTSSAGPAAKRPQRVSAPGREGVPGHREGLQGSAHSPCALTRSRSGRCRCRTPERYHSVRSVTFCVASRFGRSELFSWNAMPRSATRQTLDKTPPCCSPLALRVKHCFRPSALPTRCFLRYFRFYGGGTRACRFLILFAPPLRLPSFFFFRFGGRKTCILNMALPKRAFRGKDPKP